MSPRYFLRDGTRTDRDTWRQMQDRKDYTRVVETRLPSGLWVSTVWTGVDHQDRDPPHIFETAVFDESGGLPRAIDEADHASEADARTGHQAMVERWRDARPA